MNIAELKQRKCDHQGCGHYGAPRGKRKHVGVDLAISPNNPVRLGFEGKVVKAGWPYSDPKKSHIRYLAINVSENINRACEELYGEGKYYCRVFYMSPAVKLGYSIEPDTIIGFSQKLGSFYPEITEHIHFELYRLKDNARGIHKKSNFIYVDPNEFLSFLRGDAK